MINKAIDIEISSKNIKEKLLALYNGVLSRLNGMHSTPIEQKKYVRNQKIVGDVASDSPESIIIELSTLKLKTLKQFDSMSGQLLNEYQKLDNLRKAIAIEQQHLQELYQINETANTLSALLRAQAEQEVQLGRSYAEQKELFEKTRKKEEEEYGYSLELKRRKEIAEIPNGFIA